MRTPQCLNDVPLGDRPRRLRRRDSEKSVDVHRIPAVQMRYECQ